MLAGRIPNKLGRDHQLGVSDYDRIEDWLLALNETASIGQGNVRLTMRQRMVVPASALDEEGEIDLAENVLVAEALHREVGRDEKGGPYTVLSFEFRAGEHIAWYRHLVETAASRAGLTAQFVGGWGAEGRAETGTALRVRLIPTTSAGSAKARPWDGKARHFLALLQQLDARRRKEAWTEPTAAPAFERADPLPEDETEEVERESRAVTARIRSRRTSIAAQHPDWDEERIDAELEAIRSDEQTSAVPIFGPLPAPAAGEGE